MPDSDVTTDPLLEKVPVHEGYKVLGGVVLYQKLGQGGMGAVYRGRHLRLDVDVALKVTTPPAGLTAENAENFLQRFVREARTAAAVKHSNLIRVYDVNSESGVYYIIMDFVEGESAGDRLKRKGKLSEAEAVEICLGAAEGLAEAHAKGIVHRDVKPDNILIDGRGRVVVADLGLAKAFERDEAEGPPTLTQAEAAMGTPGFMPPEQFTSARDVGPQADVWSLGVSLYQFLTGALPWSDSSVFGLGKKIEADPLPDPKETRPELTDGVCGIIEKALRKDPSARYADCGEMAKPLRVHLEMMRSSGEVTLVDPGAAAARPVHVTPPPAKTLTLISAAALETKTPAHAAHAEEAPGGRPREADASAREDVPAPAPSGRRSVGMALFAAVGLVAVAGLVSALVLLRTSGPEESAGPAPRPEPREPPPGAGATAGTPVARAPETAGRERIVAEPATPAGYYRNARLHELGGDFAGARRAYAAYFAFRQEFLDPHLDYQAMLRMQDGLSGTREAYAALVRRYGTTAARFAAILLEPREGRIDRLKSFFEAHPDFGPAAYWLSRQYARDAVGQQTTADRREEKRWLGTFVELDRKGAFARHYVDKKRADADRAEAVARFKALQSVPDASLENPVTISGMLSNAGWMVTVIVQDLGIREIRYRLGGEGGYRSTGHMSAANPFTGKPMPNPTITLPSDQKATALEVVYVDARGAERGPYSLRFDPAAEFLRETKQILKLTEQSWIAFREYDGDLLVYFTHLVCYRDGIREVRYSLDGDALDRRYELPAEPGLTIPEGCKIFLKVPTNTKSIHVQVVFRDGSESEVRAFRR